MDILSNNNKHWFPLFWDKSGKSSINLPLKSTTIPCVLYSSYLFKKASLFSILNKCLSDLNRSWISLLRQAIESFNNTILFIVYFFELNNDITLLRPQIE